MSDDLNEEGLRRTGWKAAAYRVKPVRFLVGFPGPRGLAFANFFFQRVLRINCEVPVMIHFTSRANGDIRIGKDVARSFALSGNCYIQAINGVYIDDDTLFAPGVKFVSANHDLENGGFTKAPPIRIGKRCWIGANAVILPGVELGDDVVVAAGAVVTRSFEGGVTVAGVPARVVSPGETPPGA